MGGACFAGTQNFEFANVNKEIVLKTNKAKTANFTTEVNCNKGSHRVTIHNRTFEGAGYVFIGGSRETNAGYDNEHSGWVKVNKKGAYGNANWSSNTYKAGDYHYRISNGPRYTSDFGYTPVTTVTLNYGNIQVLY